MLRPPSESTSRQLSSRVARQRRQQVSLDQVRLAPEQRLVVAHDLDPQFAQDDLLAPVTAALGRRPVVVVAVDLDREVVAGEIGVDRGGSAEPDRAGPQAACSSPIATAPPRYSSCLKTRSTRAESASEAARSSAVCASVVAGTPSTSSR
jgi:hypothetical protein